MYTQKQVADCLGYTINTIRNHIRKNKIIPNEQGLFDEQYIHDIKAAIPEKSIKVIKRHEKEMRAMLKKGMSFTEVARMFNTSLWGVSDYFKGRSSRSKRMRTKASVLNSEYTPPTGYKDAVLALNKVVAHNYLTGQYP